MNYTPKFHKQFHKCLKNYASLKKQIQKKVEAIIEDPYHNTEPLEKRPEYDLRGLRSKRIDRNFRIIFAICEECSTIFPDSKKDQPCKICPADFPDKTIVFFSVRPHKTVYKEKKPLA